MGPNTRRYNRFTGYTTEDCACKYCLHYGGKRMGCMVPQCCCAEECRLAVLREIIQMQKRDLKRRISM